MLYLGAHFFRNRIKITALSQGFAIIAEETFFLSHTKQIFQWVNSLKQKTTEKVKWFIDEADFYNPDYPIDLLQLHDEYNALFLVNHRALCNMIQFVQEIISRRIIANSTIVETDFFLASAIRIFNQRNLKYFKPDSCDG